MTKILISPGYGAGWSTWNERGGALEQLLLTYEPLIEAVERGEEIGIDPVHPALQMLLDEVERRWPGKHVCVLGACDLKVEEVAGEYRIYNFDGAESVDYWNDNDWVGL